MRRGIQGLVAVLAVLGVSAPAAQASLSAPSTTYNSLASFESAAGGADNGTTPGQQFTGFRHFTPTGIAVDGSDPGSTAIPGGRTAALSADRLLPWGIELGSPVAVANDGFGSVNSHAGFTPPDLWAPFNSNTATLEIVAPDGQTTTPVSAMTRGLGVMFAHVENTGTTIQYYSGDGLLATVSAPQGATSFAGVLFRYPFVTRVVITLGTAEIFGFDGASVTPGGTDPTTLAAGEDLVLAEPGAGQPIEDATAGVPVSPPFASFDSGDAVADISATIDWGDGSRASGAIVPAAGGALQVSASHSYASPGSYTATVTVRDVSGSELMTQSLIQVAPGAPSVSQTTPRSTVTSVACSPNDVAVLATTNCTATVQDIGAGTATPPTGLVTFSTPTPGASFPGTASCLLGTSGASFAFCEVQLMPGQRPPVQARVTASYGGDTAHTPSSSDTTIGVHLPSCSLQALTRRLHGGEFAAIVTCDARVNVQLTAQARATRKGRHKAFQVRFGSLRSVVTAGRPTVLVIKPAPGVLPALRTALGRHQGVSLKLTLTAGSGAKRKTTTTRVSALRLS